MSDIAKKTLPPGVRPGSKGGAKTADTASSKGGVSRPDEPRSAPTPPADISKSAKDADGTNTATSGEDGGEDFSDSGEYIHHDNAKKEDLADIKEAPSSQEQEDEEAYDDEQNDDTEEINLRDNEEPPESLKELAPEPEKDDGSLNVTDDVKEQAASAASGTDTPAGRGASGSDKLTEEAKRAFDQASQNQPTSEARESFLQSAKGGVTPSQAGVSERPGQADVDVDDKATTDRAAADEEPLKTGDRGVEGAKPASDVQDKAAQKEGGDATSTVDFEESQKQQDDLATIREGTTQGSEQGLDQQASQYRGSQQQGSQYQVSQQQGSEQGLEQQGSQFQGSQQLGSEQGTEQQEQPTQSVLDQEEQVFGSENQQQQGVEAGEGSTVAEMMDFSVLKNGRVNKGGNVLGADGKIVGRVVSGILKHLVGKKVDENGDIWSDNGKIIGKAEPISEDEREEMLKEPSPFEAFPDATVDGNGMVVSNGEWVGKVVQGDIKALRGKAVDPDGDILDKGGNVIGKAERWEPEPEPEAEPEPEVDKSILAGKRVNKAGNVVDSAGTIFGRIVEGDVKRMVGRMCDKNGNVLSESGDILGKADVVPEGEREGSKEGPFAELEGCTVAKNGTVVTPSGDIVGRLTKGDGKILFGRSVDEDGDVLDKNGNVIGKAERWEPEEKEISKNPMTGRKVNREGNVVDTDGNIVGKLTSGNLQICAGKEIDDDGDVVDHKGTVIGHCSLLEDIPKAEEESAEDKAKREQSEQDKKLAIQMSVCIEQCLDKIRPICKMITEKIDKAERTPEEDRDEEALVAEVRPLIEEGGRILEEAKGIIKGLDPDGRIAANAKHKTAARDATPEEYHLADVLKDLTGDVTKCIENAKKKLEDMPHAKKELNPLWGLLNEPLFQILAAVGLLLSGVLNLVGRLLSGLGLGGLVDGLLGTLGINRVLEGLGLGSVTKSLTGGGKGGKKKGGGLLGGVLGG